MTTKSFIKTIGSKGLLSDYNTEGKKLQTELTAGDNVTIANNVISSNQVFVATYGTTTYQEIKDAYDAGKICLCTRPEEAYKVFYLRFVTNSEISFSTGVTRGDAFNHATVNNENTWKHDYRRLQTRLTFDTTPTAGSTNPVTSDGIKTAISNSVDQTYSHTSTKAQSGVAVNEAFKTRETSTRDNSYTYLGMSRSGATGSSTEKLYWKLVSFKPIDNYWTLQFEMDVSNGRKSIGSYDTEIYETKRLTIYGSNKDSVEKAIELRYSPQTNYDRRGYGNNIYYEMDSSGTVTVYIYAKKTYNSSQICRLTSVRNLNGIDNITWYEPVDAAGTQPTNPIKFREDFPAIASKTTDIGSDSVPVYVSKGKPVSCNSSNLKAGKDDDGNVIKNTYATKTALDSRIPAPTSTTGTQVLKCINGVVQWVTE